MKKYIDLADVPEDDRIKVIGDTVMKMPVGRTFAFVIDNVSGKAERYIEKLTTRFPKIFVINRFDGPINGTTTVKIGRRE